MATVGRFAAMNRSNWHLQQSNMATNMADVTYSDVVKNNENDSPINSVKPIFIEETDLFGNGTGIPNKEQYLTHVEMYKSLNEIVPASHLQGLQRVRGLWRIYLDSEEDRENIITNGLTIRKKQLQVYSTNPRVAKYNNPSHLKVRVKNVPCSADDGQIIRCLEQLGCVIHNFFRERLRVDGMLTNCQTGDRIVICDPVPKALPRTVTIGKYRANIIHRNQNDNPVKKIICNKCFTEGHKFSECQNEWVCKTCHNTGHKQAECPLTFSDENDGDTESVGSNTTDCEGETEVEETQQQQPLEVMPHTGTSSMDNREEDSGAHTNAGLASEASNTVSLSQSVEVVETIKKQSSKKKKKPQKIIQKTGQLDQFFKPAGEQGVETPNVRKDKRNPSTPTDELHSRMGTGPKSKAK